MQAFITFKQANSIATRRQAPTAESRQPMVNAMGRRARKLTDSDLKHPQVWRRQEHFRRPASQRPRLASARLPLQASAPRRPASRRSQQAFEHRHQPAWPLPASCPPPWPSPRLSPRPSRRRRQAYPRSSLLALALPRRPPLVPPSFRALPSSQRRPFSQHHLSFRLSRPSCHRLSSPVLLPLPRRPSLPSRPSLLAAP